MTLRSQIQLHILVSAGLIIILAAFLSVGHARVSVNREVESSLALVKQLIETGLSDRLVAEWPRQFAPIRHVAFEIHYADGRIDQNLPAMAADAGQKSKVPGWFVDWVTGSYPTLSYALTDANGQAIKLLVRPNPIDEIDEVWQESMIFFLVLGLLLLLTFFAVHVVFKRTLGAIDVIIAGLKRMETGDYRTRLPNFDIQEYQQIAAAIDHLTDVIDSKQQENQSLTRHGLKIQEEERRHLAKELHDELGQSLTALRVMTATARQAPERIQVISEQIDQILEHLQAVTRSMMRQLHPLVLSELGLKAALEELLAYWSERESTIRWRLNCPRQASNFPEQTAIHVYRVVQEAITNIVRHAQASEVDVVISEYPEHWLLVISDNGKGGASLESASGFGLRGIQERIQSLNGKLSLSSTHQGTRLKVLIPLTPIHPD